MSGRETFQEHLLAVCTSEGWALTGGVADGQVEVKLDDGRRQMVRLEAFQFEDQDLARLVTTIGSTERIKPARLADALRVNYGLPHGALAVHKNELVLVQTLLIGDADPREIASSVRYLAEMGDHFEKTMFGPDEH